jgi:lipoate-protein ligase A
MQGNLLPFSVDSGPRNMALDEAMLGAAAEPLAEAWLRTYGWSEPTLSLGYFQALREVPPAHREVAVVRRPTGGGAILHDREVTFALTLPRSHSAAATSTSLYRAVHEAIRQALLFFDVPAERRGGLTNENVCPHPFLCFEDRDPEDLTFGRGGAKIVGSAQRRRRGAVLIHGSILVEGFPAASSILGIRELAEGKTPTITELAERVRFEIVHALGLDTMVLGVVPESLRETAEERLCTTYLNPAWTARR